MLRLLIIFSISLQLVFLKWRFESNALALILTILGRLSKDLITDIIGSRLSFAIGKDLGFGMFGYYIREKLIKCFTELLVTRYGFTIYVGSFWMKLWESLKDGRGYKNERVWGWMLEGQKEFNYCVVRKLIFRRWILNPFGVCCDWVGRNSVRYAKC